MQMAGGFCFSSVTTCRWDNLPPCLGPRNLSGMVNHQHAVAIAFEGDAQVGVTDQYRRLQRFDMS